jgi:formaldehyde-activating enzyme involved in methanogenesis
MGEELLSRVHQNVAVIAFANKLARPSVGTVPLVQTIAALRFLHILSFA